MPELTPIIKDSFLQFSGAVLQSRALPDTADNLKPSARQIFYCLYTDHFVHEKPFQKTLKAIGSSFRVYIHGDSSAEGVIMRAGQPFAMRYPLVEVEGSYGTLIASASWSAPRYTSARLSALANYLFADLEKDTIEEWRDNYDDTERYPMHLPSKGFYNIVNGSFGVGVGASCSIPQYNLREVNNALIKLLWNSNAPYDEIYCVPDFATGAILLNPSEVKESMEKGQGATCKLRSVISFDSKERCLVVTEIPYMVYTETLCRQLEEIINDEENNPGIERFNDLTGKTPLIKIYLNKKASPDKVIQYLYKNTSFQTHFGINFTMLDRGRYPKVFGWREALQAHIDHELEVYTRGFQYDLKKIKSRIHIINGLIAAYDMIDEVIATIKSSQSSSAANLALQQLLSIDSDQAKAILDLKLSKLSKLDIAKLRNELEDLTKEAARIEAILESDTLLRKEVEKGLREVADKFGDERRTKIMELVNDEADTPIEVSQLQVSLTNNNCLMCIKTSSLYVQKRGTTGHRTKTMKDETIVNTFVLNSDEDLLLFSNCGNVYRINTAVLKIDEFTEISTLINLSANETVCAIASSKHSTDKPYIIFVTRNGMLKKSELSEYKTCRKTGLKALNLGEDDMIVSATVINSERLGILTNSGNFVIIDTEDVRAIGRAAKGVKAVSLATNDFVVSAKIVPQSTATIVSVSANGNCKQTAYDEFSVQGRATKGQKLQKLNDGDTMADFYAVTNETEILVVTKKTSARVALSEIPIQARATVGPKLVSLKTNDQILKIYGC